MLKQQFFPLVSGSGPSIIASSGNGRGRQKETPISTVRWKGSHLPAGLDGKASRTTFLPSCYQRISSLDQRIWEGRSYNFFLLSLGRCSLFHAAVIILPLSLIPPPPSSSNFYLQTHLSLPSQDSGNPFPDLESARSLPCFTRKFLFSLPGKVQQKRCTRRGRRKGGVPPQCFSPFHLSAFGQNRQFFPFRQVKKFPYSCCTFSPGLWN